MCPPYPFIRFHTILPLLPHLIRAKTREEKSDNNITASYSRDIVMLPTDNNYHTVNNSITAGGKFYWHKQLCSLE